MYVITVVFGLGVLLHFAESKLPVCPHLSAAKRMLCAIICLLLGIKLLAARPPELL